MFTASRPRTGAHLPAPTVTIGTQRRQVCAWCGVMLEDLALLQTYMSDDGAIPDYDPAYWYGFSGAAAWQASPAAEPPANACCRDLPEEGDHA